MKIHSFFTLLLVGLGSSSPARRDCGIEKRYYAVNECGMTYGGIWTECKNGVMAMPTFTVPLCTRGVDPIVSTSTGYPTRTPTATLYFNIGIDKSPTMTTSSPYHSKAPRSGHTRTCPPSWMCVDKIAVCGDTEQMYGGCYDVCTSIPPFTSPPCSLSSSTTEVSSSTEVDPSTAESVSSTSEASYTTTTSTLQAGAAYTTDPPADSIAPVIDDSKALVMAEMPSSPASGPSAASSPASDAGQFRVVNVPATVETSELVEAPQSLRGAAIAKLLANKDRKPNTENKPCWDSPSCREVQLGIPSPSPSLVAESESATSTAGVSAEPSTDSSAESPTDVSAESPVESSMDAPTEASTEVSTESPTDAPTDFPEELSIDQAKPKVR